MTIKEVITRQVNKGLTLYRVAKMFEVTPKTITEHNSGTAKKVNLKLAKTVYKKLDIVLDGYLEIELQEDK